ncbi:hypothetical protein Pyn_14486 [Prunus yedoensis var. nudiflora]|uniref:Uncharacterized protein n=1 Tax=Prunus yedoensis var. nudiflora TaxID=2094558 RepID=A0A314XXX1_PRUYE|nr:hypothetical protein Pyn_14486 [Prunus yedoensis var. nudiflora]
MHTSFEHLEKSRSQCAAHNLELQGLRNQAQEVEAQIAKLQADLKTIRNKEKEVHLQLQTNLKEFWELQKQITTTAQSGSTLRADMDAKFNSLRFILNCLVLGIQSFPPSISDFHRQRNFTLHFLSLPRCFKEKNPTHSNSKSQGTETKMAKRLISTFNHGLVGKLFSESSTKLNSGKAVAVGLGKQDKAGYSTQASKCLIFTTVLLWMHS